MRALWLAALLVGCGAAPEKTSPLPDHLNCPSGSEVTTNQTLRMEWCADDTGARHGPARAWSVEAKPTVSMNFAEDRLHGRYEAYGAGGEVTSSARFDSGRLSGEWQRLTDAEAGLCTKEDIVGLVRRRQRTVQACYERELGKRPTLTASVKLQWVVQLDGSVEEVTILEGQNPRLDTCVVAALAGTRQSPPIGGICTVRFPFVFNVAP